MTDESGPWPGDGSGRFQLGGVAQIAFVLVLIVVAVYFARAPSTLTVEDYVPPRAATKPTVNVVRPAATSALREVRATGLVSVEGGVGVVSQVGGEVVFVSPALRAGGSFTAGQPLLRIDRRDHEIRLDAAKARLRQAQAQLAKQRLKGEARRAKFQRENPGLEVPALAARIPQIEKAQAKVDRAQSGVAHAELALSRTTVSMPFAGWVRASAVQVGQVVGPTAPVAQVFAKDDLRVEASVSQDDLQAMGSVIGRSAKAQAAGRALDVVVRRISAVVDLQSRLATVYLGFAETVAEDALPRPGTFAHVVFEGPRLDGVFVLPEAAEQSGGSVWIVDDGALRAFLPRPLGRTSAGWLVEAFDAAEGVVVGKVAAARAGLPVEPVEARDLAQ